MPVYEFKCKSCGEREDSHTPVVGDARCLFCDGELVRVWRVNINKENIRAVPRG